MRCFIALDLPRETINTIKEIQEKIKKKNLLIGKFTEPENLHLTLKFLGEIDEDKVEKIRKILKEIKFKGFEVSLGEVGTFSQKFIKIIWIKLNGKGVLGLQKQIDEKLKEEFVSEFRFMSHLTLVRVNKVFDKKILLKYLKTIKIKPKKFIVDKFFFKNSVLKPEGPV